LKPGGNLRENEMLIISESLKKQILIYQNPLMNLVSPGILYIKN
jgi:hypothetical protein